MREKRRSDHKRNEKNRRTEDEKKQKGWEGGQNRKSSIQAARLGSARLKPVLFIALRGQIIYTCLSLVL